MNENVKRSNGKYRKPMPGKSTRKPQRNPFAKIPPFMIPELIKTKSGRIAVAETGGARGSEGGGTGMQRIAMGSPRSAGLAQGASETSQEKG